MHPLPSELTQNCIAEKEPRQGGVAAHHQGTKLYIGRIINILKTNSCTEEYSCSLPSQNGFSWPQFSMCELCSFILIIILLYRHYRECGCVHNMFSIARRDVSLKCAILCDLGFLACYISRGTRSK